jgi:hypothetical protein
MQLPSLAGCAVQGCSRAARACVLAIAAASWLMGKLLEATRARLVLSPVTVAAAVRVRDICHAMCAPQVCQPPVVPVHQLQDAVS